MNESNAEPAFETRQLKSAPGWYVRVAWSHGKLPNAFHEWLGLFTYWALGRTSALLPG
jgi:hypothetical protein